MVFGRPHTSLQHYDSCASEGFTTAFDTVATRRPLDISGRLSIGSGSSPLPSPRAKYVTTVPVSGFDVNTCKLHAITCNTGGFPYSSADPMRWGDRLSIGQSRNMGFAPEHRGRVAPQVPTGYTRISDPMFKGQDPAGPVPRPAPSPTLLNVTLPSGYALNRKNTGLADTWREGEDSLSRFAMEAPPSPSSPTIETSGARIAATKMSSYTRSRAPIAPFAVTPSDVMNPTQARLHALMAPYDTDPHAHKRR